MNRKDAKRVEIPSLMQCAIDLKPERCNSDVYINEKMDVTNLVRYIAEKKEQGLHYTYFHAFMAAIGKVIYNRPKLNRFIANRHLYELNEVSLAFVAKVDKSDASEELMLNVVIDPEDTIATLSEKISGIVSKLRNHTTEKKGANGATDILAKLPNPVRVPIMGMIKWMDSKGILPDSLSKNNIYYSSMIVSNLGSIHCGAIYHNLTNFGTSSSLATIGEIKNELLIHDDGTQEVRKMCEVGITLDERIGDGFYFARCARMIAYILSHPELLDEPASTPVSVE